MEARETDAVSCKMATSEPTASMAFATNWGEHWATDSPVADQQLIDTAVFRNLLQDAVSQKNLAATRSRQAVERFAYCGLHSSLL